MDVPSARIYALAAERRAPANDDVEDAILEQLARTPRAALQLAASLKLPRPVINYGLQRLRLLGQARFDGAWVITQAGRARHNAMRAVRA